MIKLNSVSKFYYSKGIIASGITKVSLELDVGEFVVITGESGSGKSTLLNVISGLDTYEEGEMYINGEETSHYTSKDFEFCRKKYIGNIFQNFNLINSYTVYQNVELVMLIKGASKKETKKKVLEIVEKVGLTEYANTKVSKLSGGQKQRVAIARALAKETSVIVADEPTGNLDSQSAQGIIQLLKELAENRLIIVVTHNFDQFADQATRVIKMHDGRIVEDKTVAAGGAKRGVASEGIGEAKREVIEEGIGEGTQAGIGETVETVEESAREIRGGSMVRLGARNTFNIPIKFFLLLVVFLFVALAVSSQYTSFAKQEDELAKLGFNNFFCNTDTSRIVLKKTDGSAFSEEDYEELSKLENVKCVVKDDIVLDADLFIEKDEFLFLGYPGNLEQLEGKPDVGSLPQADNEIVVESDSYSLPEDIVGKEVNVTYQDIYAKKMKVSGIKYVDFVAVQADGRIYMTPAAAEELKLGVYQAYSQSEVTIDGKIYAVEQGFSENKVVPNEKISRGKALVSEDMHYKFTSGWAMGKDISVSVKTPYFTDGMTVNIADTYNKDSWEDKTGLKEFDMHDGEIYVNPTDFMGMFDNGNFQSSVFVEDTKIIDETKEALIGMGYEPLLIANTLALMIDTSITDIVRIPLLVVFMIALFFIAYFVIRLIMKSRGSYFSILRILGLTRSKAKKIMDLEFLLVINIAFVIFLGIVLLTANGIIDNSFMKDLVTYLQVRDYVALYVILIVMAYLISTRFAGTIFKKSAMETYREEA